MSFTHLHVHSHYTLLQSTVTVPKLLKAVQDQGMDSVALTDRGNLFGAYEFYSAAKDAGVKAIIGCQLAMAPLGMREKARDTSQLVVLATSEQGYANLCRLVSSGWLEGFYFEPRVDLECLAKYAQDLICLTGAGGYGFLNRHLQVGANEEAARQLGLLRDIFADRLYVEVTDHGTEGPVSLMQANIELATAENVPLVATNWVHYLGAGDAGIHDVQLAIEKATTLADTRRKRMPSQEFWLKSPAEMAQRFAHLPAAIANTGIIAERCAGSKIPTGHYHLPTFPCPAGVEQMDLLRQLCHVGMEKRYGGKTIPEAHDRLAFELATIEKMGFAAYFLIVADFINWAKRSGIPVGPGRGSAAGSLVAYSLGITDMCPLRYGLLFERFLNPSRKSMPDIDIDFCKDRRGEVIEYVAQKYGQAAVTQIMTLGTMKARMAIKDVARAYEWTPEEAQDLANLVPEDPSGKHDLPVCLGRKPLDKDKGEMGTVDAMVKRYDSDARTKQVLDAALQLEKLGRSLGTHACGMIIAPGPVSEYVPVCAVKGKPATQFNMTQVEKCGLLKMDFLGLKTMSILKKAADIVRATGGPVIDFEQVPLADPATFALLARGETLGVFQCESSGFQQLIRLLKPDRFEDMIALVALYRPGPLMAGMHTQYCDRKAGRERVDYPHPVLEGVLKETYGLYIYQEQVMSISRELCGFTPAEADDLRKAMGKKDLKILQKLEEKFVEGAWNLHQFPKDRCGEMWTKILGFASYCFNKSHSACYGLIAYWTAWMKANHMAAFMTANLIYEMDNKDKMTQFVEELRSHGMPVLPPDINESGWEFTIVKQANPDGIKQTAIRFGFGGVKAVGEIAANHLIAERQKDGRYSSLFELCERIDPRVINKRVVDALIKVGACDSLHTNRAALHQAMDRAYERGAQVSKNRAQQQQTLFAAFEADAAFKQLTQGYPDIPDWLPTERLGHEKELTGYWISSHPVFEAEAALGRHVTASTRDLRTTPTGSRVTLAAVVLGKREVRTKAGKNMAILQLEDRWGRFEAVLFPGRQNRRGQMEAGPYDRFASECEPDLVALFSGLVERRQRKTSRPARNDDGDLPPEALAEDAGGDHPAPAEPEIEDMPSLQIQDVVPAALATERLTKEVWVALALPGGSNAAAMQDPRYADLLAILKDHPGASCTVTVQIHTADDVALTIALGDRWRVHPTTALLDRLRRLVGPRAVSTRVAALQTIRE